MKTSHTIALFCLCFVLGIAIGINIGEERERNRVKPHVCEFKVVDSVKADGHLVDGRTIDVVFVLEQCACGAERCFVCRLSGSRTEIDPAFFPRKLKLREPHQKE